ncbi:glycerate kinase [Timonella sp. A28]|uniref:glycerate kinase n=1 Tax=Timonella sp. A28 TaxID=3442640 RepID=UPI003EB8824E
MRVFVAAEHDDVLASPYESELIMNGWRKHAPHDDIAALPVPSSAHHMRETWAELKDNPMTAPLLHDTTLVAYEPHENGSTQWIAAFADTFTQALKTGVSRIFLSLPRYATPDMGKDFLRRMQETHEDESISRVHTPEEYVHSVNALAERIRAIDVVVLHDDSLPLLGMHGMSAMASLEGHRDATTAQEEEAEVSSFHYRVRQYVSMSENNLAETSPVHTSAHTHSIHRLQVRNSAMNAHDVKDLARHDAAGLGGGVGFALLAAGARALPAAQAFSAVCDFSQHIAEADLVVVFQHTLDGRTFARSIGGVLIPYAQKHALPVVALTYEQVMSTRELAAAGISSTYVVHDSGTLEETTQRIARSWSLTR